MPETLEEGHLGPCHMMLSCLRTGEQSLKICQSVVSQAFNPSTQEA